jgi:anti-anti-sigma factor
MAGGNVGFNLEEKKDATVLDISGELTVENAGDIKGALLEAFRAGKDVILKLKKVSAVDLSFIQILLAAYSKARSESRALTVKGPKTFVQAVEEAGFSSVFNALKGEKDGPKARPK